MAKKSKGNKYDAQRIEAAKRLGFEAFSRAMDQNMGMEERPPKRRRSK